MESNSLKNRIHMSGAACEQLRLQCKQSGSSLRELIESRGIVDIKGECGW
jgi:hypothetical protein